MKLYVDGDLKDSSNNLVSFDIDDRMNTLRMGYALTPSYTWPPVGYFDGLLDEVRIYNKALSSAEIQQHYAQGAIKHNIVLPRLRLRFFSPKEQICQQKRHCCRS